MGTLVIAGSELGMAGCALSLGEVDVVAVMSYSGCANRCCSAAVVVDLHDTRNVK